VNVLTLRWYRIHDDGTRELLKNVIHRDDTSNTNVIDYADLPFPNFAKADEGVYACERTLGGIKKEVNVTINMIGMSQALILCLYLILIDSFVLVFDEFKIAT